MKKYTEKNLMAALSFGYTYCMAAKSLPTAKKEFKKLLHML
jgi:hypothetical protein